MNGNPFSFPDMSDWTPPVLTDLNALPHGDMPGDRISIHPEQVVKANTLFPPLMKCLQPPLEQNGRAVIGLFGGSGSGKSGMAALLGQYLRELGLPCYILSGDNYPRRIPCQNDAERLRIFRCGGIKGLLTAGVYNEEIRAELEALQLTELDADPSGRARHPWLALYQSAGRDALAGYLGGDAEQDFDALSTLLGRFKAGDQTLWLKRMGRTETALWYEKKDFSDIRVLIVEWTHSGSDRLQGVDVPILLGSTPAETLAYRVSRARDGGADSPFVTMVLEIEQRLLNSQAHKAALILSKNGALLTSGQYHRLIAQEEE
ncbi:MAG: adenylylsulfate kinase [Oscillospiraceae bacterium]|nr:adenylylsulfate kinase [Oscillospiraceae bacterium]